MIRGKLDGKKTQGDKNLKYERSANVESLKN